MDTKNATYYFINKECSMELLAAMACKTIAEQKKIPQIKAFDSFIKSKTANMLFDERPAFWCNGPEYVADEYNREQNKSLDYL